MRLTSLQEKSVNNILSLYKNNEKIVEFKAPTGSGKTLMASALISKIMAQETRDCIFIIATLSTSQLPKAFENKINEYKKDLDFSNFSAEFYESPSAKSAQKTKDATPQIVLEKNKIYIFGKSSFGKDRIFTEQNIISDFISEAKAQEYKIVYIRDEAHIGAKESKDEGVKNFEKLMNESSDFTLKMTATFDKNNPNRVELKESDLINEDKNDGKWLIKTKCKNLSDKDLEDESLIDKAIEQFREIKKDYETLRAQDIDIRPAMLIQVDSKPDSKNDKNIEKIAAWESTFKILKEKLSAANLSWVVYFGDEKDASNVDNKDLNLAKISRNNDTTDCIIFKIGPATGWDIPRACMLLRLRNVCSTNLNIQTLGRIKRNPYPNLAQNSVTDTFYIYENEPKAKDYADYHYRVKENFRDFKIIKVECNNKGIVNNKKLKDNIKSFVASFSGDVRDKTIDCFKEGKYYKQSEKLIILNPILLLKRIEILSQALHFKGEMLEEFSSEMLKNVNAFNDMQIKLILLEFFIKEMRNARDKSCEENIEYKTKIEAFKPQDFYSQIQANDDDFGDIDENEQFLFEVRENGKKIDKMPLDSKPEKAIFKRLKIFANKHNNVEIWAKNSRNSNIYIEYLDENLNKAKSYVDFVLKFSNGALVYIEVKSKEDIDENKTNRLKNAYKSYFEKLNANNLLGSDLVILLVKMQGENIDSVAKFYDKRNEKLQNLSNIGNNLDEILEIMCDNAV